MKKLFITVSTVFIFGCQQAPEVKEVPEPTSTTSQPVPDTNQLSKETSLPVIDDSLIVCKYLGGSMENGYETICHYKTLKLEQAYLHFVSGNSEESKYLETVIPKDGDYKKENVEVNYKRSSGSTLVVSLSFPGGVTTVNFTEKSNGTEVLTNKSPD